MPQVTALNQAPFDFSNYKAAVSRFDTDMTTELTDSLYKDLVASIKTPINTSQPVRLMIDGKEYPEADIIADLTTSTVQNDVDINRDDILSLLMHQVSRYRNSTPEPWRHVIANSILLKQKLPVPTPTLIYTFDSDIQNAAKDVAMNDTPDNRQALINGLLGNLSAKPISDRWTFILTNQPDYDAFKEHLNQTITTYTTEKEILDANNDVQSIDLDKHDNFTSWITGSNIDAGSFNRFVMDALNSFTPTGFTEVLPINIQGLLNPVGFAFINIDSLINSTQADYNRELSQLAAATNRLQKFNVTKLSKIKTAQTLMKGTQQHSAQKRYEKSKSGIAARKQRGFNKTLPSSKWQLKRMAKIINAHISKIQSDNTFKTTNRSFMRPNRRHPNDPNLSGKLQRTNYRPDIHIFLDTSGSISEQQYKTAVTLLIKMAKKLQTNLYFTSFSHIIAQPIKLKTKNASVKQIYRQIQLVPKVDGGTEYENVWNMIDQLEQQNTYHHQTPQLSFMITDFEYNISSVWTPQLHRSSTKDTYYIPLAANQNEYDWVKQYAKEFADQLIDKGDLTIKSRMIM